MNPVKTLYLMRHAKSSWEDAALEDHNRPLLEKGILRTHLVAEYLLKNNAVPDLIISSTALRALATADIVAEVLKLNKGRLETNALLYDEEASHFYKLLENIDDQFDSVMLVGHNYMISTFAWLLVPGFTENLSTSSVFCVSFATDTWRKVREAPCNKEFFITPKMLISGNSA